MIGVEDAIARIRAASSALPAERVALADARGRVLAEDVAAAMPLTRARRTESGLADRNRSVPNGLTYGQVGSPAVKVARTISSL